MNCITLHNFIYDITVNCLENFGLIYHDIDQNPVEILKGHKLIFNNLNYLLNFGTSFEFENALSKKAWIL